MKMWYPQNRMSNVFCEIFQLRICFAALIFPLITKLKIFDVCAVMKNNSHRSTFARSLVI